MTTTWAVKQQSNGTYAVQEDGETRYLYSDSNTAERVMLKAKMMSINPANLKAVNGTVVHTAKLFMNGRNLVPAPACKSNLEVRRMVMTGLSTSRPVTCKRCLKLEA